jgi:hypothetical protein
MDYLVDGLGFDEKLKQYYTITYGWCHAVPDRVETNFFNLKSGITSSSVNDAMSQAVITRGKEFVQVALWEDKKYIPQGTTLSESNMIVLKMDEFFKDTMIEKGYNLRKNLNTKDIGTEFYSLPKNEWKKILIKEWDEAFSYSLMFLNKKANEKTDTIKKRGSQSDVLLKMGEDLKKSNKIFNNIVGGYGKTLLQYFNFEWDICKEIKIKIFYSPNISLSKQMAVKHAQYDDGTYREGLVKRIVISSDLKYIKKQRDFNIDNISASNKTLQHTLELYMSNQDEVHFYIVNKSAKPFRKMWNKVKTKLKYNKKTIGFIDEMDVMTGHISNESLDAIVNPITDYVVSFTATLSNRENKDKNKSVIYNDDKKYFGNLSVMISPHQAVNEGVNCPYGFKIVEVTDSHPLFDLINNNEIIDTIFKDTTKLIRGNMVRSIVTLIKSIKEDKKTHIMFITSLVTDCEKFYSIIEFLINEKLIPKKYESFLALNGDESSLQKYDDSKYAIVVGSPWLTRGMDTLNTDALIFGYDCKSTRRGGQASLRAVRVGYEGKESIIYIPTNPNAKKIPSLLVVANYFREDINPYDVAQGNTLLNEEDEIIGSNKKKLIEITEERDTTVEPMVRYRMDEIYKLFKSRIIGKVNFGEKRKEISLKYCDEIFSQYRGKLLKQINFEQPSVYKHAWDKGILNNLITKYDIVPLKNEWSVELLNLFLDKHKPIDMGELAKIRPLGSSAAGFIRKNKLQNQYFTDYSWSINSAKKFIKENNVTERKHLQTIERGSGLLHWLRQNELLEKFFGESKTKSWTDKSAIDFIKKYKPKKLSDLRKYPKGSGLINWIIKNKLTLVYFPEQIRKESVRCWNINKAKKLIKQHRLKTHTDCKKIKGLSGLSTWITKNKMNYLFLK